MADSELAKLPWRLPLSIHSANSWQKNRCTITMAGGDLVLRTNDINLRLKGVQLGLFTRRIMDYDGPSFDNKSLSVHLQQAGIVLNDTLKTAFNGITFDRERAAALYYDMVFRRTLAADNIMVGGETTLVAALPDSDTVDWSKGGLRAHDHDHGLLFFIEIRRHFHGNLAATVTFEPNGSGDPASFDLDSFQLGEFVRSIDLTLLYIRNGLVGKSKYSFDIGQFVRFSQLSPGLCQLYYQAKKENSFFYGKLRCRSVHLAALSNQIHTWLGTRPNNKQLLGGR